jgi:hypothetical protein
MEKGNTSAMIGIIAGAIVGMIFGCLVTWYPIRLLFCASYNYPDCEEIVLMVWPLYCLIGPAIGGAIVYLLSWRWHGGKTADNIQPDETPTESECKEA